MSTPAQRNVIEDYLARKAGGTLLLSSRGLTFGGAASSLAVILLIAQIGTGKASLVWSLGLSAVVLPMWLSLALTYEIWLALGLDMHDLHAVRWLYRAQAVVFYLSCPLTVASIGCLVYALDSTMAIVFGISCAAGLTFFVAAFLAASWRLATRLNGNERR